MYIFFHKEVRNDDHCPSCRTYYISIHKTLKDALDMASAEYRIIQHDTKDDINMLKNGNVLWIDEWIRRGNGDKYQIIELKQNLLYNLHQYDLQDCIDDEYDHDNKEDAKYMFLHINVDKDNDCPYNISFAISFHDKLEDAQRAIKNPENYERLGKLDAIWDNGQHYQIIKLVFNKIICLNEFCPQIQSDNWLSYD